MNETANDTYPGLYLVDWLLEVELQPAGTLHYRGGRAALVVGFHLAFWPVDVEYYDAGRAYR